MSDWRPIETAPMDGTAVIGFDPAYPLISDAIRVVEWTTTGTHIDDEPTTHGWTDPRSGYIGDFNPTHWMPLPKPPEDV